MSPATSKAQSADAAAESSTPTTAAPAGKATTATEGSSNYAIVEASGQQFWLQAGRYYDLDRLSAEVGGTVAIDQVLLVNDGTKATLGQPYVSGATVNLKVMEHRRGPKIIVYKMRPKKKTRRKNGHRQELTRVMVESITVGGKSLG
ncbi:MAG: 50S ribosomal protein L21 [Cyanobacteria bacterium K_DeepCast_35m_m2_023]|nr:50S ribosomal protein L21 [Cyanobacteria bacterium K_DeepCast_35m_m2_023]